MKPENFLFANEDDDSPLKAVDFGTAERCKPGEFITARAGGPESWCSFCCLALSLLDRRKNKGGRQRKETHFRSPVLGAPCAAGIGIASDSGPVRLRGFPRKP